MEKTSPYPKRTQIREGFQGIVFDGAPKDGLYADKCGFDMQGYYEYSPTSVMDIRSEIPETKRPRPMAVSITSLSHSRCPYPLFESRDASVKIQALVLDADHKIASSFRMINADGDEVWFVYKGEGNCDTSFGMIHIKAGDYIYIPRLTTYCIRPVMNLVLVGVESRMPLLRPISAWMPFDIPYNEENLEVPHPFDYAAKFDDPDDAKKGEWIVLLKRNDAWVTQVYPHSPFSRVAWRGTPYVFVLHTKDINTIATPTIHTDPLAFATFSTEDASVVVSTFKDRWAHSPPYHHMNQYDEFLFYAKDYAARGGIIGPGDATFHPQGFYHGPQPNALRQWQKPASTQHAPWREELAIMFETRALLEQTLAACMIEIPNYWKSWYDAAAAKSRKKGDAV